MIKRYSYPILFLVASIAASCAQQAPGKAIPIDTAKSLETAQEPIKDSSELVTLSRSVLKAITTKDYSTLATLIDPLHGVRFSPYAFVDTTDNHVVFREDLLSNGSSDKKFYWGTIDPSGDSINLSLSAYFKTWVYDVDFISAPDMAVDKFIGFGNSLNNLKEIYKGLHFVEFHFPGFDKKFDGMDWRSLRLVFRKVRDHYVLTAIVHDQWTI